MSCFHLVAFIYVTAMSSGAHEQVCLGYVSKDIIVVHSLSRFKDNMLLRWHSDKRIHLPIQEAQETQVRSLGWEDPLE